MAISSPPLPSLSLLSTLFSHERRRRRIIQINASRDSPITSNPQRKFKRQNHLRKKLSNTKFAGDFSANQPFQAALEVPIDERSEEHKVVSREIDSFGFSMGGAEKEGAKEAALHSYSEESTNSEILVSQQVESNQIGSEIDECARTNGMVSKEAYQLEGLVRGEEGIDPIGAPSLGSPLRIGALVLLQMLFSILHFSLGGFLKERRKREKMKKYERVNNVGGEAREKAVMDESEYASKVTEIRAMANLVRQTERMDAELAEREDREKVFNGNGSLKLDSSIDLGKKELNSTGEVESLKSDHGNGNGINGSENFDNRHENVKPEDKLIGRKHMRSVLRDKTSHRSRKGVNSLNKEERGKNNRQRHNSNNNSTNLNKESNFSLSKRAYVNGNGKITGEDPWWYRLPFVLGILLLGGENNSASRGLYSLEIKPLSRNRNPTSYAIIFQDQSDATNCCYLLESFFEDLDDISAQVVPLTIQEIKEAVQSGELNVIVIPKGKLKLYAGQPLEEVESALRSYVN